MVLLPRLAKPKVRMIPSVPFVWKVPVPESVEPEPLKFIKVEPAEQLA